MNERPRDLITCQGLQRTLLQPSNPRCIFGATRVEIKGKTKHIVSALEWLSKDDMD